MKNVLLKEKSDRISKLNTTVYEYYMNKATLCIYNFIFKSINLYDCDMANNKTTNCRTELEIDFW